MEDGPALKFTWGLNEEAAQLTTMCSVFGYSHHKEMIITMILSLPDVCVYSHITLYSTNKSLQWLCINKQKKSVAHSVQVLAALHSVSWSSGLALYNHWMLFPSLPIHPWFHSLVFPLKYTDQQIFLDHLILTKEKQIIKNSFFVLSFTAWKKKLYFLPSFW
jgi:hypothetical protein